MRSSFIELGKIATVASGQGAPQESKYFCEDGIPFIRAGSLEFLTNFGSETDCEKVTNEAAKKHRLRLFPPNTILFAKSGMSAKIGRIYRTKYPCYVVSHLAAIIPGSKIDPSYLQRWFEKHPPSKLIPNEAYPSIRLSEISKLRISLPSLSEQKRIAAILDKANTIRRKRRQAIQLANEFLRSVFLDIFGDPVMNNKGWKRCKFEEVLGNIDSGWSPKCHDRAANPDEWGVLKLGAVTSCRYLGQENKALPCDLEPKRDIEVKKGDLLFTRKNTYELVAACAFVYETRPSLMLSDTIFRFNFQRNAAILPEYAWALFTHPGKRRELQKLAGGSAGSMPNISKSRLMKQLIELPPIELQDKFKIVFYTVRSCIESQSSAHNLATEFFNSLSQRAFRGEL